MAEFPTYEKMGKKVAEKALDEFLYDGKSTREWMQIIASEDAISRQAAIDELIKMLRYCFQADEELVDAVVTTIKELPSAQPEHTKMIKEIREWINSGNRGSADYFIVDKIEEIIKKYE